MYDTGTKRIQEETWQCGYSHPLGSGRKVWVERNERCYDHVPEIVLSENDDFKHLWDFSIPPDHEIGRQETRFGDHLQERQELSKYGSGKFQRMDREKKRKMRKLKNIKICLRSSKTVECKDKSDSGGNGGR